MVSAPIDPRDSRSHSDQGNGITRNAAEGFGQALRNARGRMSQSRLAEAAGFDHSYVSRLESGERDPTLEAVDQLAKALRMTDAQADELRMSAGFTPKQRQHMYLSPLVGELDSAMASASTELQEWAQRTVRVITLHLQHMARDDASS